MHLQCISGIGEVAASCLVVQAAGKRVLADAGIRMGGPDPLPDLAELQEAGGIDVVVVTHAHADHIGELPPRYAESPAPEEGPRECWATFRAPASSRSGTPVMNVNTLCR